MNLSSLKTLFCGRQHRHFNSLDSTNQEMKRAIASSHLPEGSLITCAEQHSGKGYAGNEWHSEAGKNIMMSLLLRPVFLPARFQFYLNQVVAIGIYEALCVLTGKEYLKIKWPNDILFKNKKLCGILIENTTQGSNLQHSIIGIGINVNEKGWKKKKLPHAISLCQIVKKELDHQHLIEQICAGIEANYLKLKNAKMEYLQEQYMKNLYRIEEKHKYIIRGKKMKAKIVGLNPEGKLVLDSKEGFQVCDFKEIEYVL